jgi:hypothetical protein
LDDAQRVSHLEGAVLGNGSNRRLPQRDTPQEALPLCP